MDIHLRALVSSAIESGSLGFSVGVLARAFNVANPLGMGVAYGCKSLLHIEIPRRVDRISKDVFPFVWWNNVGSLVVAHWVTRLLIPGFTLHPIAWVLQCAFLGRNLADAIKHAVLGGPPMAGNHLI